MTAACHSQGLPPKSASTAEGPSGPDATVAKGGITHGLVSFISANQGSTGTPALLKKRVMGLHKE